jgi:hypothetical protein
MLHHDMIISENFKIGLPRLDEAQRPRQDNQFRKDSTGSMRLEFRWQEEALKKPRLIFDGSSMAPCEGRKCRSVVDAAACLTNQVYKAWAEGKMAGALLMDMQGAFDHVSKTQLTK